jgi:hypothetical protein
MLVLNLELLQRLWLSVRRVQTTDLDAFMKKKKMDCLNGIICKIIGPPVEADSCICLWASSLSLVSEKQITHSLFQHVLICKIQTILAAS